MKPALLNFLRCPTCKSSFELKTHTQKSVTLSTAEKAVLQSGGRRVSEYETEILEGHLNCRKCKATHPITGGVPRLQSNSVPKKASRLPSWIAKWDRVVQKTFEREWEDFNYDDQTIWLWSVDQRIETFCEEVGIRDARDLKGKLMVDAGCGPGVLSMNLSKKYQLEVIAFDLTPVVGRAFQANTSNLCHFVQASVLTPPLASGIADILYSHGVLHHTPSTEKAFFSVCRLARPGSIFYVWLYGKKSGWNRFRFFFFRTLRTLISRMPRVLQTLMVYVMAAIHLSVRSVKRVLGLQKVSYRTMSQFLVGIRDKYTPRYAREHTESEVMQWFHEAGYSRISRQTSWPKTPMWTGSTDLAIRGVRDGNQ